MTRSLTSGMQTAVAGQTGSLCHLIEMETSGGTTQFTTAPVDLSWDSKTWSGVGGAIRFNAVSESADERQSGVEIEMSGVDQGIISDILTYNFRGRPISVWEAHIDSNGAVVVDPYMIFSGFQNAGWRISEARDPDGGRNSATIRTRAVSRLAELTQVKGIKSNLTSHQQFFSADTFFQNVPNIMDKPVEWGGGDKRGPRPPGRVYP